MANLSDKEVLDLIACRSAELARLAKLHPGFARWAIPSTLRELVKLQILYLRRQDKGREDGKRRIFDTTDREVQEDGERGG